MARSSGSSPQKPPSGPQDDGSLIVRFHAAGWLEMAWFLYQWGDKVEVLAPEGLRDYVHPWRRSDLDGMP
jgi:predicted DNA-binding transcriptional regulator YafY